MPTNGQYHIAARLTSRAGGACSAHVWQFRPTACRKVKHFSFAQSLVLLITTANYNDSRQGACREVRARV